MEQLAYCFVAVAPVRAENSDRSEIVTQLLFGEVVTILEGSEQWRKIRTLADGYEGWVDGKQLRSLTKKEVSRWLDGRTVEHSLVRRLRSSAGELHITRGAFVPADAEGEFYIGNDRYEFPDTPEPEPDSLVGLAVSYLNVPYLWGGKTPFGIDCSGFTQTVFRIFSVNLPRDASQQAEHGMEVDLPDALPGDLAFFINDSGRIHHVGIALGDGKIIHASGFVRIDELTPEGIFRDGERTHRLHCLRRM
jgi:gamma-D-glutamyl-L-lysine dipeptidyl-peptidase